MIFFVIEKERVAYAEENQLATRVSSFDFRYTRIRVTRAYLGRKKLFVRYMTPKKTLRNFIRNGYVSFPISRSNLTSYRISFHIL